MIFELWHSLEQNSRRISDDKPQSFKFSVAKTALLLELEDIFELDTANIAEAS